MNKVSFAVLAVFIFTVPWQGSISLPGSSVFSVARIAGLALIAAGIFSLTRYSKLSIKTPSLVFFLTVLFVWWAVFSSLWNRYSPNAALFESLIYVQLAVMTWLIWQLCRSEKEHLILLQAFVLGAYVLAGAIALQFLTNPFVPDSQQSLQRYTGLAESPNMIAAIMALSLPIAWYLALLWKKGFWYWTNLLYLPIATLAIVLTASRGGFVIAVIGLALIPFSYSSVTRWRRVFITVVLGLMVVAVASVVPLTNFSRIADAPSEITEGNVSNRRQIWQAGLELYSQSPVLGIGTGSFSSAVAPILGIRIPAHNAFITVLTEMGIIGFALFALIFIVALVPLLSLASPHRTFYLFLWLALVVSMLPSNVENAQHVWALIALLTTRRAYVLAPSTLLATRALQLQPQVGNSTVSGNRNG